MADLSDEELAYWKRAATDNTILLAEPITAMVAELQRRRAEQVAGRRDGASTEVDRITRLLLSEWERVEHRSLHASYVATFVNMARVVVADQQQAAGREHVERVVREVATEYFAETTRPSA